MELKDLRSFIKLQELDSRLSNQVESIYNATKETINSISGCYNNYTMHDMSHGLRVASYMEDIAFGIDEEFEKNISKFNAFEISLLLLSAILHDIGMFIRPEDKENIKNNIIKYSSSLTFEGVLNVVDHNEDEAIKEIIRITHAQRIKEYTSYDFGGTTICNILMLDDKYPYFDDVIDICIAHGENYDYLKQLRPSSAKGNYSYNLQFLAAILRIADYLDLDKQRTPILWYKMMNIDGFSKEEWERHFIIHNEKKLKRYIDDKLQIFFEGKSSNAKIHRKYLRFIDELKLELENADLLLNTKTAEEKYMFKISPKVDDNVLTEGFKYSDLRLNLDYSSITELLMGKNIYGDCRLGLRELVQNSIDACELMKEKQRLGTEILADPQIYILFSENNNYVKIKDTGIGMTLDVVKKHFLNIGKSYYKSNEYLYENYKYKPIGQYGIGFLACFLLSDNVIVKTKHYDSNEINQIELEKNSEYVVTNTEYTGHFLGTEIILDYNKFFSVFNSKTEVITFLKKYFYTSIQINVRDIDSDSDFIVIQNNCNEIINAKADKNSKKFESINCKDYSNVFEGSLKIFETQREKSFEITHYIESDLEYYFFDIDSLKYKKVTDVDQLSTGYYHIIEYSIIDDETYKKVTKSKRTIKSKRQAILSEGRKIKLIVSNACDISYIQRKNSEFELSINDISIREIMKNSSIPYYEELLDETDYFDDIFLHKGKYINLQYCFVGDYTYYRYRTNEIDIDIDLDFYFYNKGVWIKYFNRNVCLLPCAINIMGVVNYLGDKIKLDVSRNSIISEKNITINEISNILLKHMKSKVINQPEWISIIDAMISFNCIDL